MPKQSNALTALELARATAPGMYPAGDGLYLQIKGANARSWIFRYTLDGQARWRGLGSAKDLSLADARNRRDEERLLVRRDGVDVVAARRAERNRQKAAAAKPKTFREAATEFIAEQQPGWSNAKHAEQWTTSLETYAYPVIGSLDVAVVDTPLVLKVIKPIWNSKQETARRVRGRIEAVLAWATVSGFRKGDNPARWRGHLDKALKTSRNVKHFPALPYKQAPGFMRQLREETATAPRALEFLILTASRTTPILALRWTEIDLAEAVWTAPAGHMKKRKEHRVPLCQRAVSILQTLPRIDEFVFPSPEGGQLSDAAMSAAVDRLGDFRDEAGRPITVHGFRSTFKDWAREETSFPDDLSEVALAHRAGSKTYAAYARGDLFEKRRRLMDAWSEYCAGQPIDNVIRLTA